MKKWIAGSSHGFRCLYIPMHKVWGTSMMNCNCCYRKVSIIQYSGTQTMDQDQGCIQSMLCPRARSMLSAPRVNSSPLHSHCHAASATLDPFWIHIGGQGGRWAQQYLPLQESSHLVATLFILQQHATWDIWPSLQNCTTVTGQDSPVGP